MKANLSPDFLVLWSPVANGRRYVRELKALAAASELNPGPGAYLIDAAGYLIWVGAWSDRSADALQPLVRTPPQLVAAAVNTPEYLTS